MPKRKERRKEEREARRERKLENKTKISVIVHDQLTNKSINQATELFHFIKHF